MVEEVEITLKTAEDCSNEWGHFYVASSDYRTVLLLDQSVRLLFKFKIVYDTKNRPLFLLYWIEDDMIVKFFCSIIVILAMCFSVPELSLAKSAPKLNNGKKWRIAYYEGGAFSDYTTTMNTFIVGLVNLGWISDKSLLKFYQGNSKQSAQWIEHFNSEYLSLKREDHYTAQWDDHLREKNRKDILQKLKQKKIDLVIAMGTWAGLDLANNEHSIPVLVMSTSDPIKAGIIHSTQDSGFDHVTARVDSTRYIRQLRMFHRIVGFSTLGIAFENTPDGLIYATMSSAKQVAEERDFKIIPCEVLPASLDNFASDQSCLHCYRELSKKAEAVYVTALTCVERAQNEIADIFKEAQRPSFSQRGSGLVESGIMLSVSSDSGYDALGEYNATKFGEILNGARPRSLKQEFKDPLEIAVNIETAKEIGFEIPKSILKIATEVYGE